MPGIDNLACFSSGILPISHIYIPTSFGKALSSYFSSSDYSECYVVGKWEVKPGKPAKYSSKRFGIAKEGLKFDEHASLTTTGVVTRRQSYSRMTERGSDIGRTGDSMGSSFGSTETKKDHGGRGAVLVLSIIGLTSDRDFGGLHVLGKLKVTKGMKSNLETFNVVQDACPMCLHFLWDQQDETLCINAVNWQEQCFDPSLYSNRMLLFYYDPEEFQRWKLPEEYPLGLPHAVTSGLLYIREGDSLNQSKNFYPAFSKIPLDHQDLQACSQIPSSSFVLRNPVLNLIFTRSSGLQQIMHKITVLTKTVFRNYPPLPVLNFLFLLILDSLIGYFITCYLLQFPNMMGLLHTTVDQMLAKLNHLLKWLRGAPAGLKLNPNLNSLYWRFFSYHIHLWANYIGILEPIFAVILYTIQYFGVLGATIQIGLLKDLLSLATFHVYCLYIYATRLFALQTTAIKALCRVFFGRKYNPLRKRIDSVQLTTPELFLSSFGFVILIFLLPTTMVYYTGFVFLRVPVLLIERLLHYLVCMYNKLPIISWALVYLNSPRVADEIYLVPLEPEHSERNANAVSYRVHLQSTRTLFASPNLSGGIKSIVSGIIGGTVLKD